MSKAPRTTPPAAAFDPELQNLLRAGAKHQIKLSCADKKEATRFVYRINRLRLAMQKNNVTGWEQLYRAQIRKEDNVVIVEPVDHKFANLIRLALDQAPDPQPEPEISEAQAESFLKSLREGEKKP
jgi:hypothetical protein